MLQDFRYAVRGLRKSPGFTLIAVLSLAVGIGANASIFGMFYNTLLRPLPYRDADRLVVAGRVGPTDTDAGYALPPELVGWRARSHDFEAFAASADDTPNFTGSGTPERLPVEGVSSNFLEVLGLHPAVGRGFTEADGRTGAPLVMLASHGLALRRFGGDRASLGRMVLLNEQSVAIVGVLPANFRFPGDLQPEALVVRQFSDQPDWSRETYEGFNVIGRLRRGVSPERGAKELAAITASYASQVPATRNWLADTHVVAIPLRRLMAGDTRPLLAVLIGAVGLLLLIACVNVASLQLGRTADRRREIALRTALGAGRARLARMLIAESLLVALLSAGAGVLISLWLSDFLASPSGLALTGLRGADSGLPSLTIAFLLAGLTGLLIGVAPAIAAPRLPFHDVLRAGASHIVGGRGGRARSVLVSVQVALALVLLVGSGLLLRSLYRVVAVDPGFRPHGVLTATVNLRGSRYESSEQRRQFTESLLSRLQYLPGVESAALTSSIPLTGYSLVVTTYMADQPKPAPNAAPSIARTTVTPDFFRALGIPLLAGRWFDERDQSNGELVAVVNQRFAQVMAGGADVIGRQVQCMQPGPVRIVGVVGNVRHTGREQAARAELYLPETQAATGRLHLVVRTAARPATLASALRGAVWAVDRNLPVDDILTMDQRLSEDAATRRTETLLLAAFAAVALLLSAVGIYGVVSEAVGQRASEIGLRVALGADPAGVVRMILRRSLVLSVAGLLAGYAGALYCTRFLQKLLFQVKPADGIALAASGALLLGIAVLAGYLPARRAARIDPAVALRCE